MRLEFNLVVVDDDWNDADKNTQVLKLVDVIQKKVQSKGFDLIPFGYESAAEAFKKAHHRVDLFLSDNNLGDNEHHQDAKKENAGIDYYLQLRKQRYLCDFVLYTKTGWDGIVNKLAADLTTNKRPDLFSRFTFVSRETGKNDWHAPILNLLDHILTRREELNNIRGIYAQHVSKIHDELITKYKLHHKTDLEDSINAIPNRPVKTQLHQIRFIRNGLLHNDEEFCTQKKEYVIRWKNSGTTYEIHESNLKHYRDLLKNAYDLVMLLP